MATEYVDDYHRQLIGPMTAIFGTHDEDEDKPERKPAPKKAQAKLIKAPATAKAEPSAGEVETT
ncbi:hypothetical protein F5X71_34625 [Nocardia brasiliensis]|uniref:Uncharacterized protein n=1 Tax=Nocardia brasiliensis TaxID=37326 RepID=A0A6G9Y0N3_NOCBR|nr:hypothetical protein [Nocardia brasiliensis]QIS06762.1 hypothetical protein F5X71_34625 [Nocardia brasiliensis]